MNSKGLDVNESALVKRETWGTMESYVKPSFVKPSEVRSKIKMSSLLIGVLSSLCLFHNTFVMHIYAIALFILRKYYFLIY